MDEPSGIIVQTQHTVQSQRAVGAGPPIASLYNGKSEGLTGAFPLQYLAVYFIK